MFCVGARAVNKCMGETLSYRRFSSCIPELVDRVQTCFEKKGLAFERYGASDYSCENSTLFEVRQIQREVLRGLGSMQASQLGGRLYFFHDKNLGHISCSIRKQIKGEEAKPLIEVVAPLAALWEQHVASLKPSPCSPLLVLQKNDRTYTQQKFGRHPLFANTLEKYIVFHKLCSLSKESSFQGKIELFLQDIFKENWIDSYQADPQELAYLALYAYLSSQISQEEFVIAQMAASALGEQESLESKPNFFILTPENLEGYLKSKGYDVTKEEALKAFSSYIKSFQRQHETSALARTAIEYTFLPKAYTTIEEGVHIDLKKLVEFNVMKPEAKRTLMATGFNQTERILFLPPKLSLALFQEISSLFVIPPSWHMWALGYSEDLTSFFKGRSVSVASPLAAVPKVHKLEGNPLGVTGHDIFHIALDWTHPYAQKIIDIGKDYLSLSQKTAGSQESRLYYSLASRFLDRLVVPSVDPKRSLLDFLESIHFPPNCSRDPIFKHLNYESPILDKRDIGQATR